MTNPLISVIVPCFNQAKYLPETLDSILNQTFQNWECIIVNDGSPDNTEELAKLFCEKDKRFKYVLKKNGGLSSARNAGLKQVKGDYIQFLDSDDILVAEKFEKQIMAFTQNKDLEISITDYNIFEKNSKIHNAKNEWSNKLSSDFRHDIIFRWDQHFSIPIHCALFKSRSIENIRFNENFFAKEDWLFWVEISSKSLKVRYLNEELALYRSHSAGTTHNTQVMQKNKIKAMFLIFSKLNEVEKLSFLHNIEEEVLMNLEYNYEIEKNLTTELMKVLASKAYRLGKLILKPLSFFRNKFSKSFIRA